MVEEVEEEAKKVERSVKKSVRKAEKAVEGKAERKPRAAGMKPTGRAPIAKVISRHGIGMISRQGRGFSLGELSGAGLTPGPAARWGIRVDSRRRSVIQGNISTLRGWSSRPGTAAKVEAKAKKVEEELEKVGEEMEKEAAKVEKEAVKAERSVKKEAKKVGKAVKEKMEKPKPRSKKKEDSSSVS